MPRWTFPALEDMRGILEYIAEDDADAAARVAKAMDAAAGMLDRFPQLGKPGREPATRELSPGNIPYLLVYWQGRNGVEILRVLHERQQWPPVSGEEVP